MSYFYISGALTGMPNVDQLKKFYEDIARLCRKLGHSAYLPHQRTDPIIHADVPAREVYERDKQEVLRADFVIAYVGVPSLGVGTEIEIAREAQIPIILLYEQGTAVSRMVRGNPAVIREIIFSDPLTAVEELEKFLIERC
jgi:nucleoside 2-deoxyribosyltransferase